MWRRRTSICRGCARHLGWHQLDVNAERLQHREVGIASCVERQCVRLEVDAYARAAFDGVDRCQLVSLGNMDDRVGRAGNHTTAVMHVSAAILEDDETAGQWSTHKPAPVQQS
jgi:hypothetical protein